MDLKRFEAFRAQVQNNVSKVIIGKEDAIDLMMVTFLSSGHLLIEDIPGMGKTMMIKAFSKTLDLPFKRIQFTPDLMPSDITGIHFYNQQSGVFQFKEGPLFSNIVLADEINRATPRTQSALLEAMEEKQVTSDGETRPLERPFMVMATQNPIESYGTFPLPEAQLDRFMLRIKLGYTTKDQEKKIILNNIGDPLAQIHPILDRDQVSSLIDAVSLVTISNDVLDYIIDIVSLIRSKDEVTLKVSPRGSIALFKVAQAYAAISGRDYILPEDVKYLAPFVLNHRMSIRGLNGIDAQMAYVSRLVDEIPVPLENR